MTRRAIVITGLPASGKEEASQIIAKAGFEILRMGDTVRIWAEDREDIGAFAHQQRLEHGADIWARRTLERAAGDRVVIDGCRSAAEYTTFKAQQDWSFRLVAIIAPSSLRHGRIISRARDDSREDPFARDRRELAWGVAELITRADVVIENSGDLETLAADLQAQVPID